MYSRLIKESQIITIKLEINSLVNIQSSASFFLFYFCPYLLVPGFNFWLWYSGITPWGPFVCQGLYLGLPPCKATILTPIQLLHCTASSLYSQNLHAQSVVIVA